MSDLQAEREGYERELEYAERLGKKETAAAVRKEIGRVDAELAGAVVEDASAAPVVETAGGSKPKGRRPAKAAPAPEPGEGDGSE